MQADEIRLMRMARQHLLFPVSMQQAARDLCGVQAQYLSHAMHALRIRSFDFDESTAREQMVKSWTLRGTMHVFSADDLPLMLHEGRAHFLRPCDTLEADECISRERKAFFAGLILEQIRRGNGEREALKRVCCESGMTQQESESLFNAWGGILRALCEAGQICHAVQQEKAFQPCPGFAPMPQQEAETALALRYFAHYGPASVRDAAYFFGVSQKRVRGWLDRLPVETVTCEGRTLFYIAGEETGAYEMPQCLFLAGFDPLMLGYEKKESLFLPTQHLRGIFNLSGIVMPAVLWQGRVIGRWKRTEKLSITLFESADQPMRVRMEEKAHELWSDEVCIDYSDM